MEALRRQAVKAARSRAPAPHRRACCTRHRAHNAQRAGQTASWHGRPRRRCAIASKNAIARAGSRRTPVPSSSERQPAGLLSELGVLPGRSKGCSSPGGHARRQAGGLADRRLPVQRHRARDRPLAGPVARAEPRGPPTPTCACRPNTYRPPTDSTTSTSTSPTATTSRLPYASIMHLQPQGVQPNGEDRYRAAGRRSIGQRDGLSARRRGGDPSIYRIWAAAAVPHRRRCRPATLVARGARRARRSQPAPTTPPSLQPCIRHQPARAARRRAPVFTDIPPTRIPNTRSSDDAALLAADVARRRQAASCDGQHAVARRQR